MLLSNRNEVEQIVEALLRTDQKDPKEIHEILSIEDQKQLLYATNSMVQKMPKELVSSKFGAKAISFEKQNANHHFPSMFVSHDRKTYEYVNENIQNMKKIASQYNTLGGNKFLPEVISEKGYGQQPIFNLEGGENMISKEVVDMISKEAAQNVVVQQKLKSSKGLGSASIQRSQRNDNISFESNRFVSSSLKKENPFVANNMNFTDLNANSKSIHNKYPHINYSQNSRNITAIAQLTKHHAFSQSISFPTTIMSGNLMPPKTTTFSKQTKLDVNDIMRYTLGRTIQYPKNTAMQNPFAKVPRKRQ